MTLTQENITAVMQVLQQKGNMHLLDNLVHDWNPDGDQVDKLICALQCILCQASLLPYESWDEWRSSHTLFYDKVSSGYDMLNADREANVMFGLALARTHVSLG